MSKENRYPCMIPTLSKDYKRMHLHYHRIFECLPVSRIMIVGPADLSELIESDISEGVFGDNPVEYIDEKDLLELDSIRPAFNRLLTSENNVRPTAINWYYQQFLKLGFARVCEDEYYLCWDADTLPLRGIAMFSDSGKPYFDVKSELNAVYFETIENLFGYTKIIEKSFVSEHMIFKVDFVKEMLDAIDNSDLEGNNYCEKIFSAVGSRNLAQGFSEFETYGTFVGMRHSSAYMLRDWRSFRNTNFFVDISDIRQEDLDWLSRDYDAATFEKYQETSEVLNTLFRDPRYREKLTPKQFYTSVLESGIFGEYVDGAVKTDGFNAPA